MTIRRVGLVAFCAIASANLFARQQDVPPQFRTGVELVQLDVAVLDDKRQPVRGLTAAEFTVFEEGVARPIRAFTAVDLPARTTSAETAWSKDVPPDVVSNQVGEQEGRLVVILMDRTIPVQQPTIVARRIATAAVDELGPADLAAVVSTANGAVQSGAIQNLTSDRTRLLRAINHSDPSTGISPEQEVIMGKLDPLQDGRCLCGLCVLETVGRVAEAVQDTPRRRKVLLFIGSDVIFQSMRPTAERGQDPGCETRLKDARAAMFAAVDRANLTIHSIDPQGLVNIGPQTRAGAPGGFDRAVNSGPAMRLQQQQTGANDALTARHNLGVLPARTGGRTVVGANHPEEVVPAIFRESEAYYIIGFERGSNNPKDLVRSLEVKVGRKGLRVVAQRSYVAPASAAGVTPTAAPVGPLTPEEALSSLLPSARKPLTISVTPFAGPDTSKAIARVNVDARAFARQDAAVPLQVSVMAADPTGRVVASATQTSTVAPVAAGPANVNIQSHLELAPGEYEIRAAVSDPATSAVASVFTNVSVPKFASASLSVSGIMVDAAANATAAPAATTRRAFKRGERVRALLQIYQGTGRSDPIVPVSMRVQILDAKGTAVRDQSLPFVESAFTDRRADCVITLPLSSLPAGDYLLKLEASAGRDTAGRALRFAVE
jgi:VWFA-related protein